MVHYFYSKCISRRCKKYPKYFAISLTSVLLELLELKKAREHSRKTKSIFCSWFFPKRSCVFSCSSFGWIRYNSSHQTFALVIFCLPVWCFTCIWSSFISGDTKCMLTSLFVNFKIFVASYCSFGKFEKYECQRKQNENKHYNEMTCVSILEAILSADIEFHYLSHFILVWTSLHFCETFENKIHWSLMSSHLIYSSHANTIGVLGCAQCMNVECVCEHICVNVLKNQFEYHLNWTNFMNAKIAHFNFCATTFAISIQSSNINSISYMRIQLQSLMIGLWIYLTKFKLSARIFISIRKCFKYNQLIKFDFGC